MKLKPVLIIVGSIFFYACSQHEPNSSALEKKLTLAQIEHIAIGTSQDTIEKEFGKPIEIVELPKEEDAVNWFYQDKRFPRAIFVIDKKSKRLVAKSWDVRDGDPEQNIQTALERYPQAHFKRRDAKFINPHVGSDEAWYEDRSIGISIEIRKMRNEVTSISWFAPGTPPPPDPVCIKFRKDNGLISCRPQKAH